MKAISEPSGDQRGSPRDRAVRKRLRRPLPSALTMSRSRPPPGRPESTSSRLPSGDQVAPKTSYRPLRNTGRTRPPRAGPMKRTPSSASWNWPPNAIWRPSGDHCGNRTLMVSYAASTKRRPLPSGLTVTSSLFCAYAILPFRPGGAALDTGALSPPADPTRLPPTAAIVTPSETTLHSRGNCLPSRRGPPALDQPRNGVSSSRAISSSIDS